MKKLIPIIFLLTFSCKKSSPIAALKITDMPLKTGDSWSYKVTNYPATQTDTAVYVIGSPTGVVTSVYGTHTFINGIAVDSGTVSVTANTRSYSGDNGLQFFAGSGLFDGWNLTFPISTQSSWSVSGGTVKVVAAYPNLTIAGSSYKNVYILLRAAITPGGTENDTMYIAPGVDIIQWNGFPLIAYHLQ